MRYRDLRKGVRRLLKLSPRSDADAARDADDELETFLAERVDDLKAHGMSDDDARREALRRLGTSIDDAAASLHDSATSRERRVRVRGVFADLQHDLRYTVRTLRRDAGFTAFAVAIIAIGIGASATVFSVARALLIRPLQFVDANRLVWIQNGTAPGLSEQTTQVNPYLSFVRATRSFSEVTAYNAFYGIGDAKLQVGNDAIRVSAVGVAQNFFEVLGVRPALGRTFSAEEAATNGPKAVLISHPLWERQFSSSPSIIGQTVTLNAASVTVVGVLPESFDFGSVFAPGTRIDVFRPYPLTPETNRNGNTLSIIGRLAQGATLASAAAEVKVLVPSIKSENPRANPFDPTLFSLRDRVSGRTKSGLLMLGLAVAVVMLIVCANLSNLLLARGTTRHKEMAVRAVLGAGRRRLIRQMLTESVVLSSMGAVIGLGLALVGTRAIAQMDAVSLPLLGTVTVDTTVLAFTVLLAVAAGLGFGIAPALQISETHLHDALKASGRSATDGKRGQWVRRSLVVSEVALACVLLVASGLLIRSFLKVLDVDLGFRPERVVTLRVDPDPNAIRTASEFVTYLNETLRLARETHGVAAATIADGLPLGSNRSWGISVGGEEFVDGRWKSGFIRVVTDGFVGTMGMSIILGREFAPQDLESTEKVVVINQTTAKAMWPGQDALGKLLRVGDEDRRVVGIVGDVRHLAVEESSGNEIYLPLRQVFDFSRLILIVRTNLEPTPLAAALRTSLAPVVPRLATNGIETLQGSVDRAVSPRRFFTALLGGFSVFALCLALLGIYGVISYTVTHRTQEIGVRIALGASARQVQARIIRETIELAIMGIAIGTLGAWVASRTLSGFLFGVSAADPLTYGAMIVVLSVVALLSGYLPARRASRIDPIVALRES
ncbi:MAG TPA: ABC transporter permease [Gemmatimonadaceae bacterium]